jgi:uncharacterized protein
VKLFIDSGPLVAHFNSDDFLHDQAERTFSAFASGRLDFKHFYISDYIFDECVNVIGSRTKRFDLARILGDALISSNVISIIHVDENLFLESWKIFKRFEGSGLSFTDSSSIAIMEQWGIDSIFSFDKHFQMFGDFRILS